MTRDEFQINLVSNVLSSPKNTPVLFDTKLAKNLIFDGNWDVGLTDISYPHEWFNLHKDYEYAIVIPKKDKLKTGTIADDISPEQPRPKMNIISLNFGVPTKSFLDDKDNTNSQFAKDIEDLNMKTSQSQWVFKTFKFLAGNYEDKSFFAKRLQTNLYDFYMSEYTPPEVIEQPRFVDMPGELERVRMGSLLTKFMIIGPRNNSILNVLGLGTQTKSFTAHSGTTYEYLYVPIRANDQAEYVTAKHRILKNTISSMLVYSDIVEESLIGDSQANILLHLPIQSKPGEQGYWRSEPIYYIPIRQNVISNITIKLCQDTGEFMPISVGKVMCRLHFRRVSPFH